MSIAAECPDCFRTYNLPDKYAGKSIRCKSCGGAIRVESQVESFAQAQPAYAGNWPPPAQASSRSRAPRRRSHGSVALPDPIFWLIALGVAGFIVVGLVVAVLSPNRGMLVALGLFITALVAYVVGKLMLIVTGFMEDVPQGLLVLLVPFYWLSYVFSRQPRTKLAGQIILIGLVAAIGTPFVLVTSGFVGGYRGAKEAARRELAGQERRARGNAIQGTPIAPGRPASNDALGTPATGPDRTIERSRQSQSPPETHKLYLTGTTSGISPTEDHAAMIEELLLKRDGYVPGSAKLDLEAGTFSWKAIPGSDAWTDADKDLFGLGFMFSIVPPSEPWMNPTISSGVKYAITGTLPVRLPKYRRNLDKAADMALTKRLAINSALGYVPGSVDVDLKKKIVTMKCYPNCRHLLIGVCLYNVGIEIEGKIEDSPKGSNNPTIYISHTRYLTDTNNFFSPGADHLAKIEALLLEREGYVPGSGKLDLEAGTFTFKAPPDSYATLLVYHDLFRIGLISQEEPRTEPWQNPTAAGGG